MVGDEFALTCQTHGIDAVRLEDADDHHADHSHDEQGHKQLIASCDLGNEEDAGERCVHHAGHHAGHSEQHEVLLRQVDTNLLHVPDAGEEEACEAAHEQRWRKGTTATAGAVGR